MPTPRRTGGDEPILTTRALNRALLARQHLLARAAMPATAMIEHLVGMQAQSPGDPYVALWSRLDGFRPDELSSAIAERRAVRMSLMRMTLHLVTARDALAIRPTLGDMAGRSWASSPFSRDLIGVDVAAVARAGRELLDREPMTLSELGQRLATMWPDRVRGSLAYAVTFNVPLVQVPPRGLWRRSGRPAWRTLESWLERPLGGAGDPEGLVLRYLAAFGPAGVKDIATWSRLAGVREIVERLRPGLRVSRDERGAELFDVPDGPVPSPETPAPPRFLPEYDNIALSHADRARIIAPEAIGRLTGYVGTFMVDGFVAGQWRLDRAKTSAVLVLDPFVALDDLQRDELMAEARRLLAFLADEVTKREVTFGVARAT